MKIGIFDSGKGGLYVYNELMDMFPKHTFYLYTDTENAPYGNKSKEEITRLSINACQHLANLDVEAIVIACNTATLAAMVALEKHFPQIRFFGTLPDVETAIQLTHTKAITVLATKYTCEHLTLPVHQGYDIDLVSCPTLVKTVEENVTYGTLLEQEIKRLLPDVYRDDIVVLGCTHFNWLADAIRNARPDMVIVSGMDKTIAQVKELQ